LRRTLILEASMQGYLETKAPLFHNISFAFPSALFLKMNCTHCILS
jgi:hypothetical protein